MEGNQEKQGGWLSEIPWNTWKFYGIIALCWIPGVLFIKQFKIIGPYDEIVCGNGAQVLLSDSMSMPISCGNLRGDVILQSLGGALAAWILFEIAKRQGE